ncbi:GPP34 family phosphoprotein [Tahibacter amnicola]|uniref:GPP34 family phosphoprotein n=1 Tax=Tahibacter amnicola TaxID=2976241 RepID=A0ABY6BIQ7_9GAMM|nr:GPP34 family phosphoprotein [Tahibacter amnicola]UXI69382.1 GPP34 family phosphoprotein [Tahibacter amnicola]
MLIAERFLMLVLDPTRGTLALARHDEDTASLCAAGLLLELVAQRRLVASHQRLVLDDSLPPNHPLLGQAGAVLGSLVRPDAATAIAQVARRVAHLPRTLLDSLCRRDLLHRYRDWKFWQADSLRYPLRSRQALNEAVHSLEAATSAPSDLGGLGLMVLADVAGVLAHHLDALHYDHASKALLTLNYAIEEDTPRGAAALIRSALLM